MPPDRETVSVIIPAYNAARFIERSIRSALEQAGTMEVIVVDDVSADETCAVMERLVSQDDRVKLLRRETNGGPSAARNQAIEAAAGDWIAILDADDAYARGRFAPLLELARDHLADMVADNLVYYDAKNETALGPSIHPEPPIQQVSLEKLFRSTPTGGRDYVTLKPLIRRSFLQENDITYDETIRNGEDFDLYAKCLVAGASFMADLSAMTYLYTTRDSGTSQTTISDRVNIRQTRKWFNHPAFRENPEREALVRARLDILRRRELDRGDGGAPLHRKLGKLLLALRSRAGRQWLMDQVRARLKRVERSSNYLVDRRQP